MKKLFYIIISLWLTNAVSQNIIKGTITSNNNESLENVTIQILENNQFTSSNKNGYFEIKNIPNGNLSLNFYLLGYEKKSIKININQLETIVNVVLTEKEAHLDEVIISSVFNKTQAQNVMKVEHQTLLEMQKNGASSLMDGLANIPGINQVSTGASIGKPVIRGLSGNRILTYAQGIRLENQQFGEEHGLGLSASGIESVEVIKGPASLIYGSDAIGGVLYFNPEKYAVADTIITNISQQYFSNTEGTNTSFGFKTSQNNWKFLARANYNSHLDYKIPTGERVINTRSIEKDLKYGLSYANSSFSTDFRYNYNNLDLGLPEEDLENEGSRKPLFPKQDIDNHILSINQKVFFKKTKIEADLGYIYNNRQELEAEDEIALHMKLKTANYNVKFYLPRTSKLETIIGVQGMYQTNENFGQELLIPDATTEDFGGFITTSLFLKNQRILQAGIRYDSRKVSTLEAGNEGEEGYFKALKRTFESVNAALGYKTNIGDLLVGRFNLATGFRAPNLSELTSNGVHEGSNRYEIGNQSLKNEQNVQIDANFEYNTEHFEFFINGFYNHVNNYIFIAPNGNTIDGNDVYDYLQNNAYLFGGEAGVHLHPHPLDWLHIRSSFENVTAKQSNGNYLPLIPANQWKNNFKTEFNLTNWFTKNYASVQVNYTFGQKNISPFETETLDYTLVNLAFGGEMSFGKNKVNLFLNANNILNKTYINHLSRLKNDGIVNMGRNIIIGLNFQF